MFLNNWLNKDKTIEKIQKELNINEDYGVISNEIYNNSNNLSVIINTTNIFLIIILISFIALYVVALINIYFDEKEINTILNKLGYKLKLILLLNRLKAFLLLFLSLIFSTISFFFLKIILKSFKFKMEYDVLFVIGFIAFLLFINELYYLIVKLRKGKRNEFGEYW